MLSQQYGHSKAYTYRNIISDILLYFVNATHSLISIHLNKISCSDRPTVVHNRTLSYMKGDLRLNH